MPRTIQHIDAIARRKQRDALFVTFFDDPNRERSPFHWEVHPARAAIIEWLDAHGYVWEPCGEVASETVMRSYRGSIYIDVPFDSDNASYRALEAFLEYPDGSLRMPHMRFLVIDLEYAQENAHHDEPGFWDRWAEDF
ncbi:hypothetical protein WQE_19989 [Paraburkholderia hospita]|uniref:Uncharacterized protein n=1 Tax=Paraburkholderia hospita TaxID=169430 RepID=A0ABP2PNA9_9BURK|nr:hypothetical protein [Paraburkholderia hospita]EIM99272.1 hypothetical protein WQE_19989 [Paraburkholderia hospita]OUL86615.1 hypothetical protein CA602_15380 [Paraburkholderia hospita]